MAESPSLTSGCPDLADLLLASEGELAPRELELVEQHVRTCGSCRERLQETTDLLHAYDSILSGDSSWPIEADIAALRAEPDEPDHAVSRVGGRVGARVHAAVPRIPTRLRRFLRVRVRAAAKAMPLILSGVLCVGANPPSVRADRLLTQAIASQHKLRLVARQRVAIRFIASAPGSAVGSAVGPSPPPAVKPRPAYWDLPAASPPDAVTFVRDLEGAAMGGVGGAGGSAASSATSVGPGGATSVQASAMRPSTSIEEALRALMAAHHFTLDQPLSVKHFQEWRASLSQKEDSIKPVPGRPLLELQTITASDTLRRAELFVREDDYHPVRQTLTFDGVGSVDIEEEDAARGGKSTAVGAAAARQVQVPPVPAMRAGVRGGSGLSGLDDAELDARRALQQSVVDLRGVASVRRAGRRIVIRVPVAVEGRAALEERLNAIRFVVPILTRADRGGGRLGGENGLGGRGGPGDRGGEGGAAGNETTSFGLPLWGARTFVSGADAHAFLADLLERITRLSWHAGAYADLAERYGIDETGRLPASARAKLQSLIEAQHQGMVTDLEDLDLHLAIFLGSNAQPQLEKRTRVEWREQAMRARTAVADLREAVGRLLQEEDVQQKSSEALARVRVAAAQLRKLFEPARAGERPSWPSGW